VGFKRVWMRGVSDSAIDPDHIFSIANTIGSSGITFYLPHQSAA
jgi:hypothetical protein